MIRELLRRLFDRRRPASPPRPQWRTDGGVLIRDLTPEDVEPEPPAPRESYYEQRATRRGYHIPARGPRP